MTMHGTPISGRATLSACSCQCRWIASAAPPVPLVLVRQRGSAEKRSEWAKIKNLSACVSGCVWVCASVRVGVCVCVWKSSERECERLCGQSTTLTTTTDQVDRTTDRPDHGVE